MDMPYKLEQFVEQHPPKRILHFYFYEDGTLIIVNATTRETIPLAKLSRESEDFYVQKRITFIKNRLVKSIQNHQ